MNANRVWVAAGAAVVMAVAVGVGWGVAGDGFGGSGSGGPGTAARVPAGGTGSDGDQLGGGGAGAEPSPGSGSGPDTGSGSASGSGSGSGSGFGSGSSGGGVPDNQPPVIETPGLSSDGLLLRIAPIVSDPDGDDVSLRFDVGGAELDPATTCYEHPTCKGEEDPSATPTQASFAFDHADVGYRHDATVTIIATDGRGATSRETFTHELEAIARVGFGTLRFTMASPEKCFQDQSSRQLSYQLDLSGAITHQVDQDDVQIFESKSYLLVLRQHSDFVGQEAPALLVELRVSLEGVGTIRFAAPRRYSESDDVAVRFFPSHDCGGELSYRVDFTVG